MREFVGHSASGLTVNTYARTITDMGVYRGKGSVLRTQSSRDGWEVVVEHAQRPPFRFFLSEESLSRLMRTGEVNCPDIAIRRAANLVEFRETKDQRQIAEVPYNQFMMLV